MANKNTHKNNNIWFGFALGVLGGTALTYLLGTKRGREVLKQLLDISENLEENLEGLVEEVGSEVKERFNEKVLPGIRESISSSASSGQITSVIEKIKTLVSS